MSGGPSVFDILPGGAQAYLAWCLWRLANVPVVWVVDSRRTLDTLVRDLETLAPEGVAADVFPPRETTDRMIGSPARRASAGARLEVARRCRSGSPPAVIATCVSALLQPLPGPAELEALFLDIVIGAELAPERLRDFLDRSGYEWVPVVDSRGQASFRGGLVDLWPPATPWPARVEFVGNRIESLRWFDPVHQRSIERIDRLIVAAADEPPAETALLFDHLPPATVRVWHDMESLRAHAEMHRKAEAAGAGTFETLFGRPGGTDLEFRRGDDGVAHGWGLRALEPLEASEGANPEELVSRRTARVREWAARARRGTAVWFCFATEGSLARFRELHVEGGPWPESARLAVAPLSEGFELLDGTLAVVAEADLFPRRGPAGRPPADRRRAAAAAEGERILDPSRMEPGELVVHVEHGIGRYRGMVEIRVGDRTEEVLAVDYAEGARLYVPLHQAHLLSRYVGAGGRPPELHRLGSRRWALERAAAERAVHDLAARLLETQALRQVRPGRSTGPDTPWQVEFEAAFPYAETDDQARAIAEVKRDLEARRPMDRLVCGDVGYGKTEVAMRAAFKTVMSGAQVAVLVPTTVLAQQHYDTFRERMAAFPVVVEMLSRFRSRREQRDLLRRLAEGGVDIVVGTHRLLQSDVVFRDLGLVIVDEEQRFGVEHKEAIKRWRSTVDVLTMTATPIPRTLYLGLVGARDLSVIETPPMDRLPIETIVAAWDDRLIRGAILRELDRGGQVFFLHNRVATIGRRLELLRALVPEARIEAAHGQMDEGELADLMHRFGAGGFDVLLCTTIIESGVDMPRVNTILIERADRFGLADLYQLRGRVGRYRHQAYAYLLLPRHGRLLDTARRRIAALRRHSGLGAGFRLALRDLEARGAGNLLGSEQSGHIAAVGFDLYCQLLRRTIARLKGDPLPEPATTRLSLDFIRYTPDPVWADEAAAIPADYVEDEPLRLELYRRVAGAVREREVEDLAAEFADRFGPPPAPLRRLLALTRLKLRASAAGIERIETDDGRVLLLRGGQPWLDHGRLPQLRGGTVDGRIEELLRLVRRVGRTPAPAAASVSGLPSSTAFR